MHIGATNVQEFLVSALLYQLAVVQHEDTICFANSTKAMSNQHLGAGEAVQDSFDCRLRLYIEGASCLIQKEDCWPLDK